VPWGILENLSGEYAMCSVFQILRFDGISCPCPPAHLAQIPGDDACLLPPALGRLEQARAQLPQTSSGSYRLKTCWRQKKRARPSASACKKGESRARHQNPGDSA